MELINKLLTLTAVQNGVHILCDQSPPFVRNSMVARIFILNSLMSPKIKQKENTVTFLERTFQPMQGITKY